MKIALYLAICIALHRFMLLLISALCSIKHMYQHQHIRWAAFGRDNNESVRRLRRKHRLGMRLLPPVRRRRAAVWFVSAIRSVSSTAWHQRQHHIRNGTFPCASWAANKNKYLIGRSAAASTLSVGGALEHRSSSVL